MVRCDRNALRSVAKIALPREWRLVHQSSVSAQNVRRVWTTQWFEISPRVKSFFACSLLFPRLILQLDPNSNHLLELSLLLRQFQLQSAPNPDGNDVVQSFHATRVLRQPVFRTRVQIAARQNSRSGRWHPLFKECAVGSEKDHKSNGRKVRKYISHCDKHMSCIFTTSYHWNPAGPLHHANQPRRRNSRKVSKPYKTYVGHKKEISMENIVHAQPHNGTCTPHKVVVDRIGDQALTHAPACVGYSINNEHVFLTTVHGSLVWDLVHGPAKNMWTFKSQFLRRVGAWITHPSVPGSRLTAKRVWATTAPKGLGACAF